MQISFSPLHFVLLVELWRGYPPRLLRFNNLRREHRSLVPPLTTLRQSESVEKICVTECVKKKKALLRQWLSSSWQEMPMHHSCCSVW